MLKFEIQTGSFFPLLLVYFITLMFSKCANFFCISCNIVLTCAKFLDMKKNILKLFLVFLVLSVFNVLSAQEVVSTAGDHDVGSAVQVSWTVGEPVIETGLNGQYYLTQGMHQGDMIVTAISEIAALGFEIKAYPNPVTNHLKLNVNTSNLEGLNYSLYNETGQLLVEGRIESELTTIPMEQYSPSSFLLRVKSDEKDLKLFKIIKRE